MQNYLDNLYNNLYRRLSYATKAQLIYTIIEVKQNYPELKDRKQSLYLDVKRFLYNYIENRKRKDYGYDLYKKDLFISLIKNNGSSLEQQYLLFNYLKRIFDGAYFDSEWIETEFLQIKLKIFKHSNKLKYVLLWSSQSIRNILFTSFGRIR